MMIPIFQFPVKDPDVPALDLRIRTRDRQKILIKGNNNFE